MARNKHPEITINRILDASQQLFMDKGYEQTTIQDIVEALSDLSKGAIYHHFKSKEEIIDAVMNRIAQSSDFAERIKEDPSMNGLEKVKRIFIESIANEHHQWMYRSAPSLMKNPKFLAKQLHQTVSTHAPFLRSVIEEGVQDGSIDTEQPRELSQVTMLLVNIWLHPGVFDTDQETFHSKLVFLKKTFESMGMPLFDEQIMDLFLDFQNEATR